MDVSNEIRTMTTVCPVVGDGNTAIVRTSYDLSMKISRNE